MKIDMEYFTLEGKRCCVLGDADPAALLIQPEGEIREESLARQYEAAAKAAGAPYLLVLFEVEDWNRELSPWPAPPVFGNESFGDGAEATLWFITEKLLPEVRTRYRLPMEIPVILGGYSLAAFFSLWSVYQTDVFAAASAASPSMWFPGWMEYAGTHQPRTGAIYLSLGNREEKTRNPVMSTVGDCIRRQEQILKDNGVPCILEWNDGNHFRDPDIRCAKGFAWCIRALLKAQN